MLFAAPNAQFSGIGTNPADARSCTTSTGRLSPVLEGAVNKRAWDVFLAQRFEGMLGESR